MVLCTVLLHDKDSLILEVCEIYCMYTLCVSCVFHPTFQSYVLQSVFNSVDYKTAVVPEGPALQVSTSNAMIHQSLIPDRVECILLCLGAQLVGLVSNQRIRKGQRGRPGMEEDKK